MISTHVPPEKLISEKVIQSVYSNKFQEIGGEDWLMGKKGLYPTNTSC
jgi:hypothetical protein